MVFLKKDQLMKQLVEMQQLKGALPGSKIGKAQGKIRTDNSHQCDAWKIVAFGHHLGAYQDVNIFMLEPFQQL